MQADAALVPVVSAAQSAACDAAAIAGGVPSRALMERAGAAAAGEIALRFPDELQHGVVVLAGPGNNGGDGWVVARALAAIGAAVRVVESLPAKTDDAIAERALALPVVEHVSGNADAGWRGQGIVVDALLGTGASGAPRGPIADAVQLIATARAGGATIVALDLPTGVDADTGADIGTAGADLTITFGTAKRGHLIARDACGVIVVVDIGLGQHAYVDARAPQLIDARWVAARIPPLGASSHKGTRKKLAIIGGARGMTGAAILAARAAMASGIGMVRLVVDEASVSVVQESEPYALAAPWPADTTSAKEIVDWSDGIVIGPGLGRTAESRTLVERVLVSRQGPILLDADALTVFADDVDTLASLLHDRGRTALLTPHAAEFARLAGLNAGDVLARRYDVGSELASRLNAVVLLKGVPTVISPPDGVSLVSASGTPALAAAGSGDVLSGIAGTLLTQLEDALLAGAAGAWVHGHAAERAASTASVAAQSTSRALPRIRGTTLADVVASLSLGWTIDSRPSRYPVLAELPIVGERA